MAESQDLYLNCMHSYLQIDSAMSLTSLSSVYLKNEVNRFFQLNGKVTVNLTLSLLESQYTKSEIVKRDIQRKMIEVIQVRPNPITYSLCSQKQSIFDLFRAREQLYYLYYSFEKRKVA